MLQLDADAAQQLITDQMPRRVVDLLKGIQIDEDEAATDTALARCRNHGIQMAAKSAVVQEIDQAVVGGAVMQQLVFRAQFQQRVESVMTAQGDNKQSQHENTRHGRDRPEFGLGVGKQLHDEGHHGW